MISNRGKTKENEKGYVLIDVIVTLLLLSLVMTSILGGFSVIGNIVGGSWARTEKMIQDRNEYDKLQRIPK